jgi:hypothetical protein
MNARNAPSDLDTPYELADGAVERFRREGFVHLHDVLSAGSLRRYAEEVERSTHHEAFPQLTNIWARSRPPGR